MRILVRTSKWAIWSRRLGSLALPLAVIPIFMHRERLISSDDFGTVEIIAMSVAALALFLALGAFVRLWITGDQGWGKAVIGLFLSLICLAPLAVVGWLMTRYPPVADISTDYTRPPGLVSQSQVPYPDLAGQAAVIAAFPNARDRSYPIEAAQMYGLVAALADARGWEPRARREPQTPLAEGQINGIATTLVGWRDEVAVRIQGTAQGSVVAMRSTALHGFHDLGENGRRVEEFLLALDQRVTEILRNVAPTAPVVEDEPAPATQSDED
jgi:hypothetical protein